MNDFIQSNLTEAKNVYVTGHSLGGALGWFHFRWFNWRRFPISVMLYL